MIFLEPAELFAMRTIGQQALHIATLRPTNEIANAIEQHIGTFEFADGFGRRLNNRRLDRFYFWQRAIRVRSEMRLKVTAANVEKFRRPRFDSIRRFGEFTRYPAA